MTTLADKAILSGADNRSPMLEKDMYESWKSRMELYMMNKQYGHMILESVEQDESVGENSDKLDMETGSTVGLQLKQISDQLDIRHKLAPFWRKGIQKLGVHLKLLTFK
nr:hypothetical protein [Tanacetum cinerariifolium]